MTKRIALSLTLVALAALAVPVAPFVWTKIYTKEYVSRYPDGTLLLQRSIVRFGSSEGKQHGYYLERFPNGQKKEEATYADGRLDGLCTKWNKHGSIWLQGHRSASGEITHRSTPPWYQPYGDLAPPR